jgi:glycerate kinase
MRVVVAPDKFKGTLSAKDAADALAEGWRRADPRAHVEQVPIADGGEGTLDALVAALDGHRERGRVRGPLGDPADADYGLARSRGELVAIVEMARASGLALVSEQRRDPLRATTFGTGELIRAACAHRPRLLLVCIGGSATNDAGAGMAQALGIRLLDAEGRDLPPGGAALARLAGIDLSGLDPRVRDVEVLVATDVRNPLTGPRGASAVYGPQKGASADDVARLDQALGHFAAVVHRDLGIDLRHEPGAGAAGGLGAGLMAFLGARLRPGFEVVAELLHLRERLEDADVAVTGEGEFDEQTAYGKAPGGLLRLAGEAGCRTVLVAGRVERGIEPPADLVYSLVERVGEREAMSRPREALVDVGADAAIRIRGEG